MKHIVNPYNAITLCVIIILLTILVFVPSMCHRFMNYEIYHIIYALILSGLLLFPTWVIKSLWKSPSESDKKSVNFLPLIIIFLILVLLLVPVTMLFEGVLANMTGVESSNLNPFTMTTISVVFAGLVTISSTINSSKISDNAFRTRTHTRTYMLASAILSIFAAILFFIVGLFASSVFQFTDQYQYTLIVPFSVASISFVISISILFWSLVKVFHQQTS